MLAVSRCPVAPLEAFVERVWTHDAPANAAGDPSIERVLPTGAMHLVFRLSARPLTLCRDVTGHGAWAIGHSVVGGPRSTFYVRRVGEAACSVGAQLRPGAAWALFAVPATLLAERHTTLEDLWGPSAHTARARLEEAPTAEARLECFETMLLERLRGAPPLHRVVRGALGALERGARIEDVVRASGYSHRAFIVQFETAVGLTPKVYARVRRFQRVLDRLALHRTGLADLAADQGFADQSHLSREFRAIAGVSPAAYRALAPPASNHVPIVG